ncbi:MAG TPA: GNAT family N-acetyltransferase [Conexibacter sp.]|nr:GNAT family N-acetyltransferase [Conexibacter sp.]
MDIPLAGARRSRHVRRTPLALSGGARRLTLNDGLAELDTLGDAWDMLLERTPTPFLTREWLAAWWEAFGAGTPVVATLRDDDGSLAAAAVLRRVRGGLAAAANVHSGDWDVVSCDDGARIELWHELAGLGCARLALSGLRSDDAGGAGIAAAELDAAGYRSFALTERESPFLRLPGSWDELLAQRSSNLRQQWRRRRRRLERAGVLTFRVTTDRAALEDDFDAFLRVEASGWKGQRGTAIASDPRTLGLYYGFAQAAADRGWLRLYLLELDGQALAADLGCAIGDTGFLVKTGFDMDAAHYSPGLVLRGDVLQASIDEGLRGYDFLGGPDAYKLRWCDELRPRVALHAGRGPIGLPLASYRGAVRPALGRVRARLRTRSATGD